MNRDQVELSIDKPLLNIATFGVESWGGMLYRMAVHEASTIEASIPHFNIANL